MFLFFLNHPFTKYWKLSLNLIFSTFLLMKYSLNTYFTNLTMGLGCDILSFFMIFLSLFIFSLSILSSKNILNMNTIYLFMILILLKILIMLFIFSNLIYFYIFFELSLIPMMLMILGWGMKIERLQAGIYFLFYTMFSSLPLLYCLMYHIIWLKSNYMFLPNTNYFFNDFFFMFFFLFAFLVKMPIFLFHLWLPKAHVEAPVSGSMILAGILLKLGGYGILRIMMILMEKMINYSSFFIAFSVWGGLIISLSCLNQLDMKMIVAFSSISHMSILIGGLFSLNKLGMYGSFLIMISHGLSSSGMFFLVNILYERTFSRNLIFNKGLINVSPNLTFCFFLITSAAMAAPPTINLMSEFLLFFSICYYFKHFFYFMFFMLLLSVCYSMYLFSFSQHGKLFSGLFFFKPLKVMEYFILILHWLPTNLIILKSEYMTLFF